MRISTIAAVVVALAGAVRPASSQPSARRLVVSMGQTREVDVDYKTGILCDDVTIIKPSIVTRGEHNWFIVEGVAVGKTQCRVGTDLLRPAYLFDVVVEAKRT